MKYQEFKRVIPEDENLLKAQPEFTEFWIECGLVCHMTSTEYDMTFDQIYNAIQNYYLQYPREEKIYHDEADVAHALIRLIEWGLVVTVEKERRPA